MSNFHYKRYLIISLLLITTISLYAASPDVKASDRPASTIANVPFTTQAPLGEWNDPRQMDGCEEASIVMAMAWVHGGNIPPEEAKRDIINMSELERAIFGFYQDTSIEDTAYVMRSFYNYDNITVKQNITVDDIKNELASNHLVIMPLNTQLTKSPFYKHGPIRHTVLAVGYDDQTDEIILHDPYYKNGAYLHMPSAAIQRALANYDSGVHLPRKGKQTAFISVSR